MKIYAWKDSEGDYIFAAAREPELGTFAFSIYAESVVNAGGIQQCLDDHALSIHLIAGKVNSVEGFKEEAVEYVGEFEVPDSSNMTNQPY